jgi:hypothetical protein
LQQNLQQVAPNQEKPHTTPLHSLIYSIYISVVTLPWICTQLNVLNFLFLFFI